MIGAFQCASSDGRDCQARTGVTGLTPVRAGCPKPRLVWIGYGAIPDPPRRHHRGTREDTGRSGAEQAGGSESQRKATGSTGLVRRAMTPSTTPGSGLSGDVSWT